MRYIRFTLTRLVPCLLLNTSYKYIKFVTSSRAQMGSKLRRGQWGQYEHLAPAAKFFKFLGLLEAKNNQNYIGCISDLNRLLNYC